MAQVSTARIVAQYMMLLIATIAAVLAIYWALETWFQIEATNSAMGVIVIFVAAMGAGTFWQGREAEPGSGRKWRVAAICALLTIALQGAIMGLLLWAGVTLGEIPLRDDDLKILAGVMAGLAVLELLMIRAGLWQGIRQAQKAAKLRAEKAARG